MLIRCLKGPWHTLCISKNVIRLKTNCFLFKTSSTIVCSIKVGIQKNLTIIMYYFSNFVAKHIVDVRKVGHNLESHNTKMNLWKTQSQGHPQLSRIKEKTNGPSKFWLVRFITMALCFLSICPFIIFTFSSMTLSVKLPSFDYKLNCQL